jgi:cell wall-associated NlpC family hydrolase
VERLPRGRHNRSGQSRSRSRITIVAGALALASLILPAGVAGAATATPARPAATLPSSLQAKLAQVNKLSNQIDALSQQYDAMKIQLTEAQQEAAVARETAARDEKLMASGESQIGQIAAAGYMSGGTLSPQFQLFQSSNPQTLLNQASIITQLEQENGDKLGEVTSAQQAAKRALFGASQQEQQAKTLTAQMAKKVDQIQGIEDTLNSSVYTQAMSVYRQTGTYPNISLSGDSAGVQALRAALTRIGDPYVWGAAGPSSFDCSGLVVWSYARIGISLDHFTGDLWNEGVHVPIADVGPGMLILMYNLDHVGMYVGNGDMIDAPTFGQDVQIQAVPWGAVDGVVKIV